MECLKQFRNILFGYEIHVFSDHKNLVYEATLSESQRVMRWRLLLKEFGPHIHHISGIDNIVADTLSRLKCTNIEHNENEIPTETKLQELYTNTQIQSIQADFLLVKELIHVEQQRELNKRNLYIKSLIKDKNSGYYFEKIDDVN